MTAEIKQTLVRRLFEDVWNLGRVQLLDELLIVSAADEQPQAALQAAIQQIRANMRILRAAFPDWQTRIEDLIVMPDRVLVRWTAWGTQRGDFMGLTPSGTWVETTGISVYMITNDRIGEARVQRDSMDMIRQVWAALTPRKTRPTACSPRRAVQHLGW